MPIISVIIPVYNGEKTISHTIKSVLEQSFSDVEIIVINDGSTDSTEEIVKSFADSRLKIFSYPNAGLSASRNRGLALASCEFVSFIDADDLWTSNKLESQMQALLANPDGSIAYSWTNYIDADDNFLRHGVRSKIIGDVYSKLLLSNFL